jgi:hypothetical protein
MPNIHPVQHTEPHPKLTQLRQEISSQRQNNLEQLSSEHTNEAQLITGRPNTEKPTTEDPGPAQCIR